MCIRDRRILRAAGAVAFYRHRIWTFSHAIGTARMGHDAKRAPLDPRGRFRGIANLTSTDASALPTSASVNPSLTISATALRAGTLLANELSATRQNADISFALSLIHISEPTRLLSISYAVF